MGVPRAEDGRIVESIGSLNWTSYQTRPRWAPTFAESAETSFVLPITSETLYFISRGSYQAGKVELKQSTERGDVKVDVRAAYHDERALARASVCRLRKSGNGHGVGIYVRLLLCALPPSITNSDPIHRSNRRRLRHHGLLIRAIDSTLRSCSRSRLLHPSVHRFASTNSRQTPETLRTRSAIYGSRSCLKTWNSTRPMHRFKPT